MIALLERRRLWPKKAYAAVLLLLQADRATMENQRRHARVIKRHDVTVRTLSHRVGELEQAVTVLLKERV